MIKTADEHGAKIEDMLPAAVVGPPPHPALQPSEAQIEAFRRAVGAPQAAAPQQQEQQEQQEAPRARDHGGCACQSTPERTCGITGHDDEPDDPQEREVAEVDYNPTTRYDLTDALADQPAELQEEDMEIIPDTERAPPEEAPAKGFFDSLLYGIQVMANVRPNDGLA